MRLPMRTLLYTMEQYGITLSLDGDQLKARIPPGYPAYLKDIFRSRKPEFIAALKELEQDRPDAHPPADLTDDEHSLLVGMVLHWQYSAEDWAQLWNDCQDPAKRQAWLDTARLEQPPTPEQDDLEPSVHVRIEGSFGTGRMQFDMRIPPDRWDEQRFTEQVSRLTDASWWRLDTEKRCADCRHAQPTQHAALVRCDQRDDAPACGYWWTDLKVCREWAPISYTNTRGQKADQIQGQRT